MKYAIIGYGLEGKSAEKYFRRQPDAEEIKIFSSDSAQSFTDQLPRDLSGWTLVRSPGVAPRKLPAGARTITLTREFFAKCPCPIIGVTGTKGKGTTTSLTAAILAEVFKTSKFYHPEFSPGSSENSAQILKRVQ
ncbi:MAG: hypothetical protein LBM73_02955, partial [Candidatus Nomurabacteria bacterium]|nr:hypothetical protein [Candidatus Nomurabacteria bacterium]